MANKIRIKRRSSGAPGAPSSLENAELAFNEVDDVLYYGKGTGGAGGTATTVDAVGGRGAVVMLSGAQTVAGVKTFSASPVVPAPTGDMQAATKKYVDDAMSGAGLGDMLKAVYDTDGDGKVNAAVAADTVPLAGVTGAADALAAKAPLASPAFTGTPTGITKAHVGLGSVDNTADSAKPVSTAQQTALDAKAPLASPAFTGTPTGITKAHVGLGSVDNTADTAKPVSTAQQTALNLKAPLASPTFTGAVVVPTQLATDNSTKAASTAMVQAAIAAVIDGAPSAIDTLRELAAALGDDPNFAATVTTNLSGKVAKASNLSDLADAGSARTNLGLGSLATQASGAVAITGGSVSNVSVDGVTLDGGTY